MNAPRTVFQSELISEMSLLVRSCRALVVGLAAIAATLSMTQVAAAAPDKPKVPKEIRVPGGNKVFLVGHATGDQIYTCNNDSVWGSPTPDAELKGDNGEVINHFAGPTWEAEDGSKVVGKLPPVASVTPDPTAIPWLLLRAKPPLPNDPSGLLANTTFIQRVATTGGLPPANPCTPGEVKPVGYTADYYFWEGNGKKPGA